MDIPVLYLALPVQFRFIVKKELFKIPLFGLAMKKTGYIPVDRSGGRESLKSIQEAAAKIKSGTSVVVFPEGTRSHDGNLGPFKLGGMLVALKANCRIVPVAISGSHHILPKGARIARCGDINVFIGRPLTTEIDGKAKSREKITQEVWEAILDLLKKRA
jgi:1-acyl-sn-glycerol-3-phosphate acyltransferase